MKSTRALEWPWCFFVEREMGNMTNIALSGRLKALADFIDPGARAADIGTDHGYLPIWLLQNGRCKRVIAADVNEGPLAAAARSAEEAGLRTQMDLRLGDGLTVLTPGEVDTVVIAGMGGETILNMLTQAPWAVHPDISLILQPQSKLPELLCGLHEMGCMVEKAKLAEERGRIYLVIQAAQGPSDAPNGAGCYVPKALQTARDPLLGAYIAQITQKLNKAADGVAQSETEAHLSAELRQTIEELSKISIGGDPHE